MLHIINRLVRIILFSVAFFGSYTFIGYFFGRGYALLLWGATCIIVGIISWIYPTSPAKLRSLIGIVNKSPLPTSTWNRISPILLGLLFFLQASTAFSRKNINPFDSFDIGLSIIGTLVLTVTLLIISFRSNRNEED